MSTTLKLPARAIPQPVAGPSDSGIGRHWATQLYQAVQFLKQHGHPIRLQDLALMSGVEALLNNAELLNNFKHHEKVVVDDKMGLFSYKPDYDIKSKADLESLIIRYAPRGGLPIKKLRESWANVTTAIEELEKDEIVLVTRTGRSTEREGTMKAVFRNEHKKLKLDQEFLDLWKGLKAPTREELTVQLKDAGLKTASTVSAEALSQAQQNQRNAMLRGKKRKGPGSANRRIKLTNTHLKGQVDLSKDYTPAGR